MSIIARSARTHREQRLDYANDPHRRRVPSGPRPAHESADTRLTRLTDVDVHRLIRRGTTFGPPYDPNTLSELADTVPRSAIFLFISARAMATIEFLQQSVSDGDFIGANGGATRSLGGRRRGDIHQFPRSRSATHPGRRDVRCTSRRWILFHAEHQWIEVARELERIREANDVRSLTDLARWRSLGRRHRPLRVYESGEHGAHRPRHVRFFLGRRKCDLLERHRSHDRRSPRHRCRRRRRREFRPRRSARFASASGSVSSNAVIPGRCAGAELARLPGVQRAVAHGERREGCVNAGGRCPGVRRPAFRSVLPRLDRPRFQATCRICCSTTTCSASSSSSIRTACSIRRRARCAVRSPRPSRSHNRAAASRVLRTHRLGRTARADQHTAHDPALSGRRFARPVESADAVRDPE